MMGTQAAPERLFYDFCLDEHVPRDHILRQIERFLDLSDVRLELKPFYSHIGRTSIDPELMIRMLIVGYCFAIEEVHLNLAYRWFCRLGLDGKVSRSLHLLAQPPWPLPAKQPFASCDVDSYGMH
jgi:transposase